MKRLGVLCLILMISLLAAALPANAFANVTSFNASCSSLSAVGTTNSPFVILYAYNYDTEEEFIQAFAVSGGSFSLSINFAPQAAGTWMNYEVWGSPTADTANFDWDGEEYFDVDIQCGAVKPSGAAGVPSGFVFRTVICDTPVYNTAAGQPVGSAAITAGQTWYVNPVPVDGDDGRQWTEIYVSSTTNPFIPTACVQ